MFIVMTFNQIFQNLVTLNDYSHVFSRWFNAVKTDAEVLLTQTFCSLIFP